MGVLMITHDLMEAVRLSDAVLVMAAEPGRIVCRFELSVPAAQRDEVWVYHHTAELLQSAAVRASFGLPAAVPVRRNVAAAAEGGTGTEMAGANWVEANFGLRLVVPAQPALTTRAGPRCG